ncbi:MAG: hypothetical protein DCC68_25900 [Planctomycetota bacterium]|nr:MAG: hypothetical protein DCC68_25900 [Planctomycetota bacterium]
MALRDKEWAAMSNVAIAEHIGVSHQFVENLRSELSTVDSCDKPRTGRDGKKRKIPKKRNELSDSESSFPEKRKGKDGKSYPASETVTVT